MAIIKPTLSLTSNAETATTDAGPMSVALALSTTLNATVDLVTQRLITTSTTLNQDTSGVGINGPIDGSALAGGDGDTGLTPGTVGSYVYLKNTSSTAAEMIYIAIVTAGGNQTSAVPAASGTTALDEEDHETLRTFTLEAGDFAWFPWDYTGDIHWEAATGNPKLEMWIFDRSAS